MRDDKIRLHAVANQDGAAILDLSQGTITTLNSSAAYIWQAIERGSQADDIVAGLAHETGMNADAIRPDVLNFITQLKQRALLS